MSDAQARFGEMQGWKDLIDQGYAMNPEETRYYNDTFGQYQESRPKVLSRRPPMRTALQTGTGYLTHHQDNLKAFSEWKLVKGLWAHAQL